MKPLRMLPVILLTLALIIESGAINNTAEAKYDKIFETIRNYKCYVNFVNETGEDIYNLYISSKSSDSWGNDLLGNEIFTNKTSRIYNVGFKPHMEVRIVLKNGKEYLWTGSHAFDTNEVNFIAFMANDEGGITAYSGKTLK